ncbi:TetR/AcrR family transcriptional regulator [Viridibacillus sp. YIM B01967]|uniref:TetR/AcrR family transcriptional regulator n=1 Tax=Viridibacillus soli TaxID=2798301 RepID=A0ABS1H9M2_9BACL|nr:TetR/AcrR family transcriptional regulator [Viridibacillus soli]MBK3496011.1 TetR/AcrR family transcriptional regulator [Viridibacillus soli]
MNNRKRQVIIASQKLFIKKGFQNTSIQDILDESHISKGTFYNYFASKNECLIAILAMGREQADVRKHELLIGQDPTDKDILAKQIAVLMQVNREQNLIPIFESIFHSGEPELKEVVMKFHLNELKWLTKRIVDVYGEASKPHCFDATILLFGMIQHMLHIWKLTREDALDPVQVVKYAICQLDAILPIQIANGDTFLGCDLAKYLQRNFNNKVVTKEYLLEQLEGFSEGLSEDNLQAGKEYTNCLLTSLQEEIPHYYIIEAIVLPFNSSFKGTIHAAEAQEIANHLWLYIRQQNV